MKNTVVSIDGYQDVPASNGDALLQALANQPLSVGIDASGRNFQLYKGVRTTHNRLSLLLTVSSQEISMLIPSGFVFLLQGVLSGTCGTNINHGLVAVGFGSEQGTDYIIVKNSWGIEWGEEGYIRFDSTIGGKGQCGINQMVAYPIKKQCNITYISFSVFLCLSKFKTLKKYYYLIMLMFLGAFTEVRGSVWREDIASISCSKIFGLV